MKTIKQGSLIYLLLLSFFTPWGAFGKSSPSLLKKVENTYSKKPFLEAEVEKTLKSDLLGKETLHKGNISLGNGKFRWETKTPEETLLVFDGTYIWNVQYPNKDFGGQIQVAKGKPDKKNKSHLIFLSLLGKDLSKNFKIVNEEKQDGDFLLTVEPKSGDLAVKDLKIGVRGDEYTISKISYVDDIGNLTTLKFLKIKFKSKIENKVFKYSPPKGAQVTDL